MATLYVSTGGNDSRTYVEAQTEGTPWKTLGRACWGSTTRGSPNTSECAQAGDTVVLANGTYALTGSGLTTTGWGGPSSRVTPLYTPAVTGTIGNPITFQIAPGAVVTLETVTTAAAGGPVIGTSGSKNYIIWNGFTLNEATAMRTSDTSNVTFGIGNHCEAWNLKLTGSDTSDAEGNHIAMRWEFHQDGRAYNNLMHDYRTNGELGGNQQGIQLYSSSRCIFEHNEIYNVGTGIDLKGWENSPGTSVTGNIVRYNYIHDCGQAGSATAGILCGGAGVEALIYQNILVGKAAYASQCGILCFGYPATANTLQVPLDCDIYNNVVVGYERGLSYEQGQLYWQGIRMWNNIVSGCDYGVMSEAADEPGDTNHEHNTYFNSGHASFVNFAGNTYNLAGWQGLTPNQDNVSPLGLTSDPQFTGSVYKLGVGSPCRDSGRTFAGGTVHRGAYTTDAELSTLQIGIESDVDDVTPRLIRVMAL